MKLWGKILLILILIVLVIWGIVGLLQIRLLKSIEEEIQRGDKSGNRDNEAKFWFEKGRKFYFSSDYDKAIEYFTRAIEIKSNNPEFYYWRAMAYYHKGTRIYLKDYYDPIVNFLKRLEKKKYLNKAIEDLTEATDYNPFDAYYFEELGKMYYIIGEYGSAIAKFERAIKLKSSKNYTYPSRSFLYFLCGKAYLKMGKYEKAINSFTKAIDLFPHSFYYEERGKAYYKIGEFRSAIEDFTKAMSLEPDKELHIHRKLYLWLAKSYYAEGEYDSALGVLTQVIESKPNNAEYYNFRGMVYLQNDMYENAVEDFTKAITYGGWNFIYYQNRGEAYKRMGLKNKARIDFIKAKILKFLGIGKKSERDDIEMREAEIKDLYIFVKFRISDIEEELAKKEEERKRKEIEKNFFVHFNLLYLFLLNERKKTAEA
jgi:tetratricopeptide (TPR) repeat protein